MSAALTFVDAPPGLAPLVDFTLNEIDGATGVYTLQAAGDSGIRLFVLDAAVYLADYAPVISDEHCMALGVTAPEEVLLLVVVNPGSGADAGDEAGDVTVNLMAPIVVNAATGVCAQIVLEGSDWPVRAELAPAA